MPVRKWDLIVMPSTNLQTSINSTRFNENCFLTNRQRQGTGGVFILRIWWDEMRGGRENYGRFMRLHLLRHNYSINRRIPGSQLKALNWVLQQLPLPASDMDISLVVGRRGAWYEYFLLMLLKYITEATLQHYSQWVFIVTPFLSRLYMAYHLWAASDHYITKQLIYVTRF
jgi:hypothetical protein